MSDTNRDPLGMMTPAQVARLAELRTKAACCNAEAAQFWQALANGFAAQLAAEREDHRTTRNLLLEARAATAPRKERKARRGR